jgi:hypothetical protein
MKIDASTDSESESGVDVANLAVQMSEKIHSPIPEKAAEVQVKRQPRICREHNIFIF